MANPDQDIGGLFAAGDSSVLVHDGGLIRRDHNHSAREQEDVQAMGKAKKVRNQHVRRER